ncbi:heme-binding domain-containing protein [Acidicapsa acidisoli]|uniref:heme-binding domain-containing protein n=1 Tax=Acidicapsa acidisoli TaxID=1615681 RepID=UPI00295BFAF3|nr:heme-binding domain-containing protein [Acidicapsa acidisoli]
MPKAPYLPMLLRFFGIGVLIFAGLQFVRPELKNPPVSADIQAPPEVKAILKHSCYSCHSNETELPWFDRLVPAY